MRRQVVHQSDVETLFLLADMEEDCHLELPLGFVFDLKLMVDSGVILSDQLDKITTLCEQFEVCVADQKTTIT